MCATKVQSFEVSDSDALGDIVSRDRKGQSQRLKVGLLCAGWFEWWPMFPDSDLEENIRRDADTLAENIQKRFGDQFDFVYPGMIDTLDTGFDVGEQFRQENVDVVILAENTYLTDFIPIEALDHLPAEIPVIILNTQATRTLAPDMTNIEVIRYEGLVGVAQLVGAFSKMGRDYKIIVGAIDDDETYEEIGRHLKVLGIIHSLKRVDIGLLGHTFRGMYDIEIDKTKIKGAIGANTLYIDVQHMLNIWNNLDPSEIDAYSDELEKLLPIDRHIVNDEDRKKSLSLGLAMQKLVKKFNLDCVSVLGQHHVEVATQASADFSFYSVEKLGVMTTHEGDLANLVMKHIVHKMTDKLPVFLEWTAFDEPSNTLLLTHHGVVDPEPFADIASCRWAPSPEKWDFTGNGYSIEYAAKPGPVTLASLIDDTEGWKILISSGECVEMQARPCYAPQFYFRPPIDVKQYIKKFLSEGVAHHVILVYGDYREHLELLADYLKIRKVILED